MVSTANQIWADGPSTQPYQPDKSLIREWGTWVESIINAFLADGGLIYTSRASLYADLSQDAHASAWVMGDPTSAYNGIYMKVGASGTGSWTRVSDLPFSYIVATDVGAGTPNAIQAASGIPISGSSLVVTNVFEANTDTPVTIAFNGGSPLTIKTNSGNDIVAGGLVAGMLLFGFVSGSTYRLISDQVSSAIVAAAEAQAVRAEAARDAALAAVPNAFPANLSTLKALPTATVRNAFYNNSQWQFRSGDYSAQIAFDTTSVVFAKANDTAATAGAWVRIMNDGLLTPEMAGAVGNGVADDSAAFNTALALLAFIGGGTLRAQNSYKLRNVAIPSNVTVDARDANIVGLGGGATNVIWSMRGTASGVRKALGNINKGSILVVCTTPADAGTFSIGDYVLIQNEVFASPGSAGKNQEIARIAAANASTGEVSLENHLIGSYVGSTPTIEKISPVLNSRIIGGSTYLADASAAEGGHIYLDLCVRCLITEVTIEGVNNLPGIRVGRSTDIDILGNRVRVGHRTNLGGYGYGISLEASSHGIRVHRNHVSKVREILCTDRCRFVIFSENQVFGNYINGINSHSSQNENVSIINNHINSIVAGVAISFGQGSGSNNDSVGVVSGNIIAGTFGDGIQITATGSSTSKVVVANNVIRGFGQNLSNASGIYATSIDNVTIIGNQVIADGALGTATGIFISGLTKGIVNNNIVEGSAYGISVTVGQKISIQGNRLEGITSQCIRIPNADSGNVWILDNYSNVSNQSINATGTYQHRNSWQTLP